MTADIDVGSPLQTEGARQLLLDRYFAHPMLTLAGVDGIDQDLDDAGTLVGLSFPDRYMARRNRPDVQASLHEMGHFVTLAERRIVRPGFGFGGGVPELGWEPWRDFHTKAVSHIPEAEAFAWEHILMTDLFGMSPDIRDLVSSLRYAVDFDQYPGADEREKIDFVSVLAHRKIVAFRVGPSFDEIWRQRVRKLPALIAAENVRMKALAALACSRTPIGTVAEDWAVTLDEHRHGDLTTWRVSFVNEASGDETSRDFDTDKAAVKWFERVIEAYRPAVESPVF